MNQVSTRILVALLIIAVGGAAFPYLKKAVEIRSETRKWVEKWEDRTAPPVAANIPGLAQASQVPQEVKQDQSLSLAQSPWVIASHLIIAKEATLTIEPGVEILIAAGADIQVYGRITASGKKEQPIRFQAYSDKREAAWAGIFIRSDRLSEFKYAEFENSRYGARLVYSSASWEHCEFKNVREICSGYKSDFAFNACRFDYRGYNGQGNINVMKFYQGFAHIEDSVFFCPNSDYKVDGIDADYMSRAIFRGNRFYGGKCDNSDAIDIGHGSRNILIENNLIIGFIDKAISVGEEAEAIISNNVIANCAIGVGVKDRGRAKVINSTFYENDYGIRAYEKVAGLGGGYVEVDWSVIARSKKSPTEADALSSIEVSNTLCDEKFLAGFNNYLGVPEFEDTLSHKFNLKGIAADPGSQLKTTSRKFGASL